MKDSSIDLCAASSHTDCSVKLFQASSPGAPEKIVAPKLEQLKPMPPSAPSTQEWTLAVDLTLNMSRTNEFGHVGAEQKSTWLKSLAEQTANKPVAMVVQVHKAPPESRRPQDYGTKPGDEYERYVIKDGKIRDLRLPKGDDPADNLKDLVTVAGTNYPSKHFGMVVFSHGFASEGIKTDTGSVTMPQFAASVESALKKIGRPKLDLVGFDACLMGETNVLSRSQRFTERVVASPELVPCQGDKACGFDLNHWFGALLDKPEMSGKEFGNAAVDMEAHFAGRGEKNPGPSFVGNYDLGQSFDTFKGALNTFGFDLAHSISAEKGNRDQLAKIVGQTERYDRFFWNAMDIEPKDLMDFTKRVKEGVQHGEIKDISGKMVQDADALLRSYTGLLSGSYFTPYYDAMQTNVTPQYLEKRSPQEMQPYDKLGGISIFLPDKANEEKLRRNPKVIEDQISPDLPGWKSFINKLVL